MRLSSSIGIAGKDVGLTQFLLKNYTVIKLTRSGQFEVSKHPPIISEEKEATDKKRKLRTILLKERMLTRC